MTRLLAIPLAALRDICRAGFGAGGLSEQGDPHDRRLRGRRRQRHLRALDRTEAVRAHRLDRDHREQAGRGRPGSRRITPPRKRPTAIPCWSAQAARWRSGPIIYKTGYYTLNKFFQLGDHDRRFSGDLVVHPDHLGDGSAGSRRRGPRPPRQGELFDLVARLHAADRAVQDAHRREGRRHSVQEQWRDAARRGFRNAAMAIIDPPPTTAQVQAGKLRALAVTGAKRTRELPDVPTLGEAGVPDVVVGLWSGFFVPTGTPKPIIERLSRTSSAKSSSTRRCAISLIGMAVNPAGNSPDEFRHLIAEEIKMWQAVVKEGSLKFSE